ncbi:hypothetical protein [Roseisolibacter sp. H3M3-2]|uniref:hypothetical protein n=1 Tax=Roseisolibacter sp. H3M3-2 TaxID=3031323 RepID=UPI0023DA4EA8|nr:hypothetical protein [Roseisolibacter sp. H3M3-2]MDF1503604.1 hypothetical protein [Roseisolibacter sp. H3M3-2]
MSLAERLKASPLSGRPLRRSERLVAAAAVGALGAARAWGALHPAPQLMGKDFTYPWRAARALLDGRNPYEVIVPSGPYPLESHFPYPLPAAFPALPLAHLPVDVAATAFMAATCALFGYAIARDGLWRLWALASVAFVLATSLVQWSPLLVAGALLPGAAWALSLKPTLGAALFVYRPSRWAVVGGLALAAVALALVPTWPLDWVRAARTLPGHPSLVTQPWGWVPLLALARWRLPEARLVAALALVPQNLYYYDQLLLWLVPWNALGTLTLSAGSWLAWIAASRDCPTNFCGPSSAPWILALLYVPATAMALLRAEPDGSPAPLRRLLAARLTPRGTHA